MIKTFMALPKKLLTWCNTVQFSIRFSQSICFQLKSHHVTIQDENKIRKSIEKRPIFNPFCGENHDITNTFPATRVQALAQLHHKSIVKSDHVTTLPINSIRLTWASWLTVGWKILPCDQTFKKFKKWQAYNFIKYHIKSCFYHLKKYAP